MRRIEVIDVGTVSVRMGIADVDAGEISTFTKKVQVCDLGEGLDATGRLSEAAIARVLEAVAGYLGCFKRNRCDAVVCTLTQSAREAQNANELLEPLRKLGLNPQVLDGQTEGLVAAFGAVMDVPEGRSLVADSGGGSTELCLLAAQDDGDGSPVLPSDGLSIEGAASDAGAPEGAASEAAAPKTTAPEGATPEGAAPVPPEAAGWVVSTPVGSRRVTERFLAIDDPPSSEAITQAYDWCVDQFRKAAAGAPDLESIERLVVCGGASTTLAAVHHELEIYNPALVHGTTLSLSEVQNLVGRFAGMQEADRALVPGVHPRRAPVVLAAAVICAALMEALGFSEMYVSEADNLQGLALLAATELDGAPSPLNWLPDLTLAES